MTYLGSGFFNSSIFLEGLLDLAVLILMKRGFTCALV